MQHSYYPLEKKKLNLLIKYSILNVDINYDYDKVFSLINPEHQIIFEKCKKECETKKFYINNLELFKCTDGLIINILFKKMNYGNNYDIVEAVFPIDKLEDKGDSRFSSLNELQICVKNPDVFINIKEHCIDIESYNDRLKNFYNYKLSLKNNNKYKTKIG